MKKLLLSILSVISFSAFSQWSTTTIFSSGEDCFSAFGKGLASDASSSALNATSDDGATWGASNTGVPASGLSFGTLNGSTLYAFRGTAIYQSTTGNNWTALTTSAIPGSDVIKSMATVNGSVIAVTNPISGSGSKFYQLGGSAFSLKSSMTTTLVTVIESMNSGQLWAGTTTTLNLQSLDGGMTWTAINGTLAPVNWWDKYTLCMGSTSTTQFFGNYGGRMYKSTNGGATWTGAINISTGTTISISDIFILSNSNILVACDSGFYYSNDGGTTFNKNNLGLNYSNGENYLKKITATANYILASTGNGTIVRRPINQIFSGIKENILVNLESKVYPNPANGFAVIEASDLMFNDKCEVKLNDVLGREVGVFEMKEGKSNLNLENFSKGLYTYSVYNNKMVVSKGKLVVN